MKNKRALAITVAFFAVLISLSAAAKQPTKPVKQPVKRSFTAKPRKRTKFQRAKTWFGITSKVSSEQMIKIKQDMIKRLRTQIKKGEGKIDELKDRIKKHQDEIRELKRQKKDK